MDYDPRNDPGACEQLDTTGIVWLSTGYAIELCIVMHGVLSIERILLYSCQIEMCFLQIVCVHQRQIPHG